MAAGAALLQWGLGIAAEDRFRVLNDRFRIGALQWGLGIAAEDRHFVQQHPALGP